MNTKAQAKRQANRYIGRRKAQEKKAANLVFHKAIDGYCYDYPPGPSWIMRPGCEPKLADMSLSYWERLFQEIFL